MKTKKNSNSILFSNLFPEPVMLFHLTPWLCLIFTTFLSIITKIECAIAPPPWSDPTKNPCAKLPGGWQLLYWPPLKQCFKIFQVFKILWYLLKLFFKSTNILTVGLSMSRNNGIKSSWWWNG